MRYQIASLLFGGARVVGALPLPKEGLLVPRDRPHAIRKRVQPLLGNPVMTGKRDIRAIANQAVASWPAIQSAVEPYVEQLLDLEYDRNPSAYIPEPARAAASKLVRLLNTTNAGLNDYATVDCTMELLSSGRSVLWSKKVTFGRRWDGPFRSSSAMPEYFNSYGDSFRGILEPGVVVPFPAAWSDIPVDLDREFAHVSIRVDTFWAWEVVSTRSRSTGVVVYLTRLWMYTECDFRSVAVRVFCMSGLPHERF